MAVLEAVRGWEQIAGLPHINDVKKDEDEGGEEPPSFDDQSKVSHEETEHRVESILKTNYVSLLIEHDKYLDQAQASSMRELPSSVLLLPLINLLFSDEPFFFYSPYFRSSFSLRSFVRISHPRS